MLGKVFNNVMPWNLPQHLEKLREGKKKEEEGKKKDAQYYVLKTFPSTLKDEGKGRKKGERVQKKDAQVREENIFKGAGKGFQQCYALKPSPAP